MKVSSLRLENVRQFKQPLEIKDLKDGINLFCGPNESGKSTLVRALRAAFLERYRARTVTDLLPFDEQQAAPEIAVTFETQQQQWRVEKRFLRKERCMVQVGRQQLDGQEAEEQLAALLGYSVAMRGSSEAKHWGIPGLLWIEQGTGHELRDNLKHAKGYVQSALGEALGDVASSAGDALMSKVVALRGELVTANTAKARGEYAKTLTALEDARARQQVLDEQLQEYQQQLEQVGHLRSKIDEDSQQPWLAFRARAEAAHQQLAEVERWLVARENAARQLEACQQKQQWLQAELIRLEDQQRRLQQYEQEGIAAQQAQAVQRQQIERYTLQQAHAQNAHQMARETVKTARAHAERNALTDERTRIAQRLAAVSQQIADAQQIQAELQQVRQRLHSVAIDERALPALRALHEEKQRLHIQRESVATRITFALEEGQQLHLEGETTETVTGQNERLLLAATTLHIPGVGRFCIQPGGVDSAACARQWTQVLDNIQAQLAAVDAHSLADAEQRAEQQRHLTQHIRQQEMLLSRYAPQGVEQLLREQEALQQHQEQITTRLAAMPLMMGTVLSVSQAEMALEIAEAQLDERRRLLSEQQTALALCEQRVQRAQDDAAHMRATVQSAEYQQLINRLRSELTEQRASEVAFRAAYETHRQHIEDANPDVLRQDIERFSRSAEELEREAHARHIAFATLQGGLARWGEQDVEAEQAKLMLTIKGLEQRQAEFQRRVAALDMLYERLSHKRKTFVQQMHAPLKKRLTHYLRLLFPHSDMQLNENLEPESLQRTTHECAEIEKLSFGTREQVSLLSRLAYADVLKEAGKPTLIILDDVLTNSDAERLEHMKRVLFDAAQRHQMLLFSCHPEQWRDVGVVARELSALKAGL